MIFSSDSREGGGSELVRYGPQHEPLDDVERFLSRLRLDSREEVRDLNV
jgi:hypothetical protein